MTGIVVGSCRIEAECMVAVEIDPDTLDAADHSAAEAGMGVAVGYCVAEMVEIERGTDSIVETIVGYFSIAGIEMVVVSMAVEADLEARDTLALVVAMVADTVKVEYCRFAVVGMALYSLLALLVSYPSNIYRVPSMETKLSTSSNIQ